MSERRTIARPMRVEGIALFLGCDACVMLMPAEAGEGVYFELNGQRVAARANAVTDRVVHAAFASLPPRNTNLAVADGAAFTVEHVLSAAAGLGVTDLGVRLECAELPIGDGSAMLFVDAMDEAGVIGLGHVERPVLRERVLVGEPGGVRIEIEPAERMSWVYELDYGPRSPIARQRATWDGDERQYREQIAPARTYCLKHEAEAMSALGLFERFRPADLLVIGEHGPIENALRFDNEPSRHKLLDLIGDLALGGLPMPMMSVRAYGSGHAMNHDAARAIAGHCVGVGL
jgi:UDP-3-O-acyl-N-acetylglucosamine deacetylase